MPRVVFLRWILLFGCPGPFFGRGKCFTDAQVVFEMPTCLVGDRGVLFGTPSVVLDGDCVFGCPGPFLGWGECFVNAQGRFWSGDYDSSCPNVFSGAD